jgi:hypothetical protein
MAKSISFPYIGLPIRNPATKILLGTIYRPLVPIQIYFNNKASLLFEALVDSGADKSLFPMDIGTQIGIDFSTIKPNKAKGIGGMIIKTYSAEIDLKLKNFKFQIKADFSQQIDYPLLGREGFFDLFTKIEFQPSRKRLVLEFN